MDELKQIRKDVESGKIETAQPKKKGPKVIPINIPG